MTLHNTIGMFDDSLTEQTWKFELTEAEVSEVFNDSCYRDVLRSSAFQRLKDIHFLGSIDYTIDTKSSGPSKRHTRYQHSLGVARLALAYSRARGFDIRQERLAVVSALLHDIGHAPLSHSLESVFKETYGIDHHKIGDRIIRGDIPLGDGLFKALHKWDINPFYVLMNIEGIGHSPYRELFSYAINIDTIEAILRGYTYISGSDGMFTPFQVLNALLDRSKDSQRVLDLFWSIKHRVYSHLINSPRGVVADFLCQQYMRDNLETFSESFYFGTESELRGHHAPLFHQLEHIDELDLRALLPNSTRIPCQKRTFFVEETVTVEGYDTLHRRYTQRKEPAVCSVEGRGGNASNQYTRDRGSFFLFGEDDPGIKRPAAEVC